jgi:flagellar basal body-associated protein FliL
MKNKNIMIIVAVVLVIVATAGGFFGGMMFQKNQTPSLGGAVGRGNFVGRFGAQGGQSAAAFRPVRGQVLDMSNNSLTVKMSDGSTKIVVLSESTAFMQSTKAALSDVKTGDTVNVVGTANSDGSVTATDIQINPPAQGGFARPGGAGQGAAPVQQSGGGTGQ